MGGGKQIGGCLVLAVVSSSAPSTTYKRKKSYTHNREEKCPSWKIASIAERRRSLWSSFNLFHKYICVTPFFRATPFSISTDPGASAELPLRAKLGCLILLSRAKPDFEKVVVQRCGVGYPSKKKMLPVVQIPASRVAPIRSNLAREYVRLVVRALWSGLQNRDYLNRKSSTTPRTKDTDSVIVHNLCVLSPAVPSGNPPALN